MKLGATLYVHNTLEAVPFYMDAFGLTLGYHAFFPDGTYLHAALLKDGQEVFAVSEAQNDAMVALMLAANLTGARPTMSYGIDFASKAEIDHAYGLLTQGGTILRAMGPLPWCNYCADVVDKYGVYWYLCQ